ncbi:NF038122 family metalloprotease [Pseudanabaena minima]|uniref:NF038122 family metalloprotease n=1 Tax=Pseudanabaena minima TaxID=890415 RepID=UPI003DA9E149
MQFNFSYAQGVSQTQMAAFEMAGKIWSSYLTDNVTINIAVDVQKEFAGNTIAGAIARTNDYSFSTYANALKNDADPTITDMQVVSSQTVNGNSFKARYDAIDSNQLVSLQQTSSKLSINSANAKSVGSVGRGIDTKASNVLDGYIVMRDLTGTNTSWDYNFTRQNTTPKGSVDFIGVAIHEIGHVLGFQSSIDRPWVGASNLSSSEYKSALKERANQASTLDLFRYSNKSRVGFETNIDLSVGGDQYFGLGTNGISFVGRFDSGVDKTRGGNGFQASHWQTGGIMDAEIQRGQTAKITGLDLIAFDAIGWDIAIGGINKIINYAQLEVAAKQIASQKTTQNINNAMALMFDNSDIYMPKTIADPSLEARTGSWWQELYARTGGWWQAYFARTGGWWQGIKGAFGEEAIFDSLDGDNIEFLQIFDGYATDWSNSDVTDALTGKAEGAMLVGEESSAMDLGMSDAAQFIDWGSANPLLNFQNTGFSILDQQQISQGLEFGAELTKSNVVLGSNKSQTSSISDSSQLLGDSLTPWWLSDSSSLWTVR